jgi:hypothetical protein
MVPGACVALLSLQEHGSTGKAYLRDPLPICCVFGWDLGLARLFLRTLAILLLRLENLLPQLG